MSDRQHKNEDVDLFQLQDRKREQWDFFLKGRGMSKGGRVWAQNSFLGPKLGTWKRTKKGHGPVYYTDEADDAHVSVTGS